MAITPNPKRKQKEQAEKEAEKFISGAGAGSAGTTTPRKKEPFIIYVSPEMMERIVRAADRRGISRSSFIVSCVTEKLEAMES